MLLCFRWQMNPVMSSTILDNKYIPDCPQRVTNNSARSKFLEMPSSLFESKASSENSGEFLFGDRASNTGIASCSSASEGSLSNKRKYQSSSSDDLEYSLWVNIFRK